MNVVHPYLHIAMVPVDVDMLFFSVGEKQFLSCIITKFQKFLFSTEETLRIHTHTRANPSPSIHLWFSVRTSNCLCNSELAILEGYYVRNFIILILEVVFTILSSASHSLNCLSLTLFVALIV